MAGPLRVLVVEDEMMIALLIEDMLNALGCEVAGMAMRLEPALQLARASPIDFAILDVNLDGRMSFAVAEILEARGVPFAFATGYGRAGLDPRFADRPVIKKPFDMRALEAALPKRPALP
jgi:DNA-binding response OmpR family regulator